MDNKPCISPFTFKLEDCLACSSCIQDFDIKKPLTYKDLKDQELTFLISPHSKISMFNHYKNILKCTFTTFEKNLSRFIKHKFTVKKMYDTSYIKDILFNKVYNQPGKVIISDCPGTVSYIEKQAHHLIKYLSVTKSQQQALLGERSLSVVQCFDKMIENPHLVMTTYDFYKMIVEEGFLEYIDENIIDKCEEWEKCRIVNHYGYLEYILRRKYGVEDRVDSKEHTIKYQEEHDIKINGKRRLNCDSHSINKINIPNLEYESRNGVFLYKMKEDQVTKKYIRILGLEPFLNFIKETKKGMDYEVAEIYICNQGCINGPGQLYVDEGDLINNINIDNINVDINEDMSDIDLKDRSFKKEVSKKVNFKVDW